MTTGSEEFNSFAFEKRLTQLKDTQESIQALSSWCLKQREHHKKIVVSWLNVLKRAKIDQRLILFYLANDVIQYSKRKNYEFVESWGTTLQKATPLVRDDKVKNRILRIFKIWEERKIYDDEFLTDLTGLLSVTGKPASEFDGDFQLTYLVNKIKQCAVLEEDSNSALKQIEECRLPFGDFEKLSAAIKESSNLEEVKSELDAGVTKIESFNRTNQKLLVAREALCHLLQKAEENYSTQRGEVKVIVNAYKNFGSRVRGLKRKLDDMMDELPSMRGSPVPSPPLPDEPVPSPGPDEDLDLPFSQDGLSLDPNSSQFNDDNFRIKSFGSFLGNSDFSFANFKKDFVNSTSNKTDEVKHIEVINTRSAEPEEGNVNINSLLKSLIPPQPPVLSNNDSVYRPRLTPPPPPPPLLPGLDLLNRSDEIDGKNRHSNNYYNSNSGNHNSSSRSDSYRPDGQNRHWNKSWNSQGRRSMETPESPPVDLRSSPPQPPSIIPVPPPVPDVDHRQLLAPPPSIPADHRMLPPLPSNQQNQNISKRSNHKGDVDHRNLISLTMGSLVPPPPAPPITPWTPQASVVDQDYRCRNEEFTSLVPPPLPPLLNHPMSNRRMPPHNDNVESIDMEMSDEEMHEPNEEDFGRHGQIESSMARIHGHQMSHHGQYRKHEMNRDKPFNNSRYPMSDVHKHQNDGMSRTNLVRINSNENLEEGVDRDFEGSNVYYNDKMNANNPSADVFQEYPNAMNPSNPNMNRNNSFNKSDDDWERSDSEVNDDSWQRRQGAMNAGGNFSRMRPPFTPRMQINNTRRPPPLLSTPFPDEKFFSPRMRGKNNFRRPWGGFNRPPRGGFW